MDRDNNLLFRRQFIMGTAEAKKFAGWSENRIGNKFFLYCHADLDVNCVKTEEKEVYVLGYILDPFNPEYTDNIILEEIIQNNNNFTDVLAYTAKYSGRWVLIWKDASGVKIMNDACGTREIYYYFDKKDVWCGSQPSIIAYELGLNTDMTPGIQEFINSSEYKRECAWIGEGTIYKNLLHLLPNHYLDMELLSAKRFWPDMELVEIDMDTAVKEVADIIQGTIMSVLYRFKNIMLSVTAGIDSRMNLAACMPIKDKIKYIFCMECFSKRNVDYKISSKLLGKLHLKQDVIGLHEIDNEFTDTYHKNVTLASDLPSKRFIYSFYKELPDYIHVSGVGAGIAKSFYCYDNKGASAEKICIAAGHKKSAYAKEYIARWMKDAESVKEFRTINIYDIFYWENRMGNWGAKSSSEQDIAIEETWPYNNRRLLSAMLSVNEKYRKPPFYKFHRKVIKYLWEETLCMPVNPNIMKKSYCFARNCINSIKHVFAELGCKMQRKNNGSFYTH